MAQHKVVFEFEASIVPTGDPAPATIGSKHGWTESYYDPEDLSDAAAVNKARLLKDDRRGMLTPGWSIVAARVSQLAPVSLLTLRKGRHVFYPPGDAVGQYPGALQDEQPYDGIAVAYNYSDGRARTRSHRGIGQNVINAGGRYLDPPAFRTAFDNFMANLNGGPLGFPGTLWAEKGRVTDTSDVIERVYLDNTGPYPGSAFAPTVVGSASQTWPGVVADHYMTISGARGIAGLNGTWRIRAVGNFVDGGFTYRWANLAPKRRSNVRGAIQGVAHFTAYSFQLFTFASGFPQYGVSRRTGRPTQLTRGRRSAQVL